MLVTFLPSSNGFGHLNRSILLASFFKDKGWDCNIWCLKKVFNKITKTMPKIENIRSINCLDLSMPSINEFINRTDISKAFIREASEKLSNNDLIISDNHIEGLLISKKVILSANFFWHQNYCSNQIKDKYNIYCSQLIDKFNPYVISSEIFQDRMISPKLVNIMVGLIVNKNSLVFNRKIKYKKDSILVSAGLTHNAISEAIGIIQKLVDNKIHLKRRVFIEPRLINYKKWPKEIEIATYTEEMYKSLVYAFIRPGLGTLVNCLSNNVCPICFSEDKNFEMKNNKNVIKEKKIGIDYEKFDISFLETNYMENIIKNTLLNMQKLNFNGTSQFYSAVLKILN